MKKITMKLFILSFFIAVFSSAYAQSADNRIDRKLSGDLVVRQISEKAYLAVHRFPWAGNSLLVVTDKGRGILIDTPYTPEATRLLVEWAENELGLNDFVFINSEFHVDNLGGNAYGLERGFRIIGSNRCARLIDELGPLMMEHSISLMNAGRDDRFIEQYRSQRLYPPNDIFELPEAGKGFWMEIDNLSFEIFFPGPGHTSENVLVFLPGENILYGSNIIRSENAAGLGNLADDGQPEEYADSVKRIIDHYQKYSGVIVVPGHGEIGGFSLIDHTLELSQRQ